VGATAAVAAGRLAAQRIATLAGKPADAAQAPLLRTRRRELRMRRLLDVLYRPDEESVLASDPQTIVCRCEHLRIADLRATVPDAGADLNFVKSASRCGMGPCQGRQCSHSSALLARRADPGLRRPAPLRPRAPLAPLTLQELARFKDVA
jgi:NADPH-dependent 2,4-dienoyl-CoA reductase/sulfur reductase-like enzyme